MWRWGLSNPAERDLRRLDRLTRRRIFDALDRFVANPQTGDVRKLQGREDEWRLRVGDWRIRFRYDLEQRVVVVLRVLDRKDAYRD